LYDTLKKPLNATNLFTIGCGLHGPYTQYIVRAKGQLKHFNCITLFL